MLIILFFEQLLWFFGIHGSTIAWSFVDPIIQTATVENLAAFHAGTAIPNVVAQPFIDNFLQIGGSGATLPLVIFLLLFAKSRTLKDIGRLSAAPSIFNVNEPVVFGLPIVMTVSYTHLPPPLSQPGRRAGLHRARPPHTAP